MEEDDLPCTIWLKKLDGKWRGVKCCANGDMLRVGKTLLQHYSTKEKLNGLLQKKAIWTLKPSASDCQEELSEFIPDCGASLMKMQADEVSAYCYVLDEKDEVWYFGYEMKHPLAGLVEFIDR